MKKNPADLKEVPAHRAIRLKYILDTGMRWLKTDKELQLISSYEVLDSEPSLQNVIKSGTMIV